MRKELFDREELYTSEDHVSELVIMNLSFVFNLLYLILLLFFL